MEVKRSVLWYVYGSEEVYFTTNCDYLLLLSDVLVLCQVLRSLLNVYFMWLLLRQLYVLCHLQGTDRAFIVLLQAIKISPT